MRNHQYAQIASLLALSLLCGSTACLAERDSLTAGPSVPPADVEKQPARKPKLLPVTQDDLHAELKRWQTELLIKPQDGHLHCKLAETYRKLGRMDLCMAEYQKAVTVDPCLWVAYHQLIMNTSDEKQLDALLDKLSKLESQKPKELLLRVALSELYEKRGNYYQAARTLVDCTYNGGVPEKWRVRVNARIHNMLVMAKSQKLKPGDGVAAATAAAATASAAPAAANSTASSAAAAPEGSATANTAQAAMPPEEDLDIMPAPLPMPRTRRSIAQAKLKDAKEVRGMGNTPLLP